MSTTGSLNWIRLSADLPLTLTSFVSVTQNLDRAKGHERSGFASTGCFCFTSPRLAKKTPVGRKDEDQNCKTDTDAFASAGGGDTRQASVSVEDDLRVVCLKAVGVGKIVRKF